MEQVKDRNCSICEQTFSWFRQYRATLNELERRRHHFAVLLFAVRHNAGRKGYLNRYSYGKHIQRGHRKSDQKAPRPYGCSTKPKQSATKKKQGAKSERMPSARPMARQARSATTKRTVMKSSRKKSPTKHPMKNNVRSCTGRRTTTKSIVTSSKSAKPMAASALQTTFCAVKKMFVDLAKSVF